MTKANEVFLQYNTHGYECKCGCQDGGHRVRAAMIAFAKLHVKAALEAAAEKAEMKPYPYNGCSECGRDDMDIDKKSILNAYPENLIQ